AGRPARTLAANPPYLRVVAMQTKRPDIADDLGQLSLKSWGELPEHENVPNSVIVDCGWGRLVFGQTFAAPQALAAALSEETVGERDVALYVREHHVVLAESP